MDVFDAKVQQSQQHDHRLLLVPCDVVDDGQIVDVIEAKDLLEFQRNHRQGVGVIALSRIQHTRNASYLPKGEFVILIFCAARSQDYRILGQSLRKIGIIISGLCASVAARHHHKLFDRAGLDRGDDLISQCQNLRVCETTDDLAGFQFGGRRAVLRLLNESGEILGLADAAFNVLAAGIARCAGRIEAFFITVLRRYDTVGGHENGAVKRLEFLLLLPPGVSVIARKMHIFLECGIIMGRQHLGMGVYIHAGSLRLLQ